MLPDLRSSAFIRGRNCENFVLATDELAVNQRVRQRYSVRDVGMNQQRPRDYDGAVRERAAKLENHEVRGLGIALADLTHERPNGLQVQLIGPVQMPLH